MAAWHVSSEAVALRFTRDQRRLTKKLGEACATRRKDRGMDVEGRCLCENCLGILAGYIETDVVLVLRLPVHVAASVLARPSKGSTPSHLQGSWDGSAAGIQLARGLWRTR